MKRCIESRFRHRTGWSLALPAAAALNVFACEPEWGALAQELGGDKVDVYSATTALQDAHRIEARPSLIARARNADLMICSGSELEIGWVPLLLTQSGNDRIQPGSPGFLEAAQFVARIEIPQGGRSLAGRHASGRQSAHPHRSAQHRDASPTVLAAAPGAARSRECGDLQVARGILPGALAGGDPALGARRRRALKGVPVVVYHKDFSYFIRWLGMREVGEPRAQAGHTADARASRRTGRADEARAGEGHRVFALQRSEGGAVPFGAHRDSRR